MRVYIVIKQGIHYRGIAGIWSSLETAKSECDCLAKNDDDNWHDWNIECHETELRSEIKRPSLNGGKEYGMRQIVDPVVLYTRKKGVAIFGRP